MQYNRTILENGLRVITIPMTSFESATVLVMVGAGSRYETSQNNGISHFLEHMAFKGTQKRPNAMAIAGLIDGMGGEFNAFTGKETTGYYIKSANTHVETCLDVLSDMLLNSKLDPEEIQKEKGVILEELNLYEDTPARKIPELYESLLYGDTPMGWDIGGNKDVIRAVKREDFVKYMQSLYSASNMTVVVSGGIDTDKVLGQIKGYFAKMNKFDTLGYNKVIEKQEKPAVLIKKKDTEQVHIGLGVRTVDIEHPDKYALEVLSAILGGGMSSRLFNEIREKRGLAYYVRSSSDNYLDCGTLVSFAGVDAKRTDEAISVMREQYAKIASAAEPVVAEELTKAKEFLKGHLVLDLEDSRSVASFFAHQELLEKHIDTPTEVLQKIEKVSLEEVAAVAKKYLVQNQLNLAIIGNFDDSEKFRKLLE